MKSKAKSNKVEKIHLIFFFLPCVISLFSVFSDALQRLEILFISVKGQKQTDIVMKI